MTTIYTPTRPATICLHCLGFDPMHCEPDGWRGDCPWFLGLRNEDGSRQTCGYGCHDEPECQTCCPGIEPDGWGPNPGGDPCDFCGGTGTVWLR